MPSKFDLLFQQKVTTENQLVNYYAEEEVELYMKREDLLHPIVSGNKFRKLKYNLKFAIDNGYNEIITFGGAYSNHISATAEACRILNLPVTGIIRGEELEKLAKEDFSSNPTLSFAHQCGMKFKFVSRELYRDKEKLQLKWKTKHPKAFFIPEGGTNQWAVKGCEEILSEEDKEFDYITSPCGTGGTLAGLIEASENHQQLLGFPALKGDFLQQEIKNYTSKNNWKLVTDYHFGGYAKINDHLVKWMNDFHQKTKIKLDPIYTAKMMFGIEDLIKNSFFPKNTRILAVHTGGLQGIEGVNKIRLKKGLALID